MIREFWTENYLSIRNRQCLNFEAAGDNRDWIGTEVTEGMSLNKVGVIFGPNASGKSNMLKALKNVFSLLFISSDNMGDIHRMVIYNVGKIISRISVRLD